MIRLFVRLGVMAAALVCLVVAQPGTAFAQEDRTSISGKVVQGTADAALPEGTQAVLLTVDETTGQIVEQTPVDLGPDGAFLFDGLLAGPDISYRVAASTAGRYSPSVDMSQTEDWSAVELTVYDTTTSLDDIVISSMVTLVATVDRQSKLMSVLMVANIENRGDRTWEADLNNPATTGLDLIRFSLPAGFSDLTIESDLPEGDSLPIDTGVAITNPVPPGEFSLLITYIAAYDKGTLEFPTRLPFGADLFRMMVPDGSGTIAGEGIGAPEAVVVNDQQYLAAEARDVARGAVLNIRLEGLPQANIWQSMADFFEGRTYILIIVWVVAVALLGLLAYAFFASRGSKKPLGAGTGGSVAIAEDPSAARQRIVAEIAALDDEHSAGQLPEAEYQKRRDDLKSQALKAVADSAPSNAGE